MIMPNNGPVAPPLSYLPSLSTSPSIPIHNPHIVRHSHSMRRVSSSPLKDQNRPRGPSDPTNSRHHRLNPCYIPNGHDHECADDYLPTFLRDQQSTNAKLAIKQMAEHRVLLQSQNLPKSTSALEEDSDDEYAWYLKNPHRYVRRPRDRSAKKQRRKMVLYGERFEERDDVTNRNLFSAYVLLHYGVSLLWGVDDGARDEPCRSSATERTSTSLSIDSQACWNGVDVSDEDGSTLFWTDEYDLASSPTLGNGSIRYPKCSEGSLGDKRDSLVSTSSDPPIAKSPLSSEQASPTKAKRPPPPEGKRNTFFRTNSPRVRSGSHRRFSFLRIFSS